jgi:uncharacterized protein
MSLVNRIKADSVQAMKYNDKFRLSTLRMLVAELEKEKVSHKLTEVSGLSDSQAEEVISRQIKKLEKEKEAYEKAGVLSDAQEKEQKILFAYLPKQMTQEEILREIELVLLESSNMGEAMKKLGHLKGKADMAFVSQRVKEAFKK